MPNTLPPMATLAMSERPLAPPTTEAGDDVPAGASVPLPPTGPSPFADAMTQAVPLLFTGIGAGFAGAATAARLALPRHPLQVAITGLSMAWSIARSVKTTPTDTPHSPASPASRLVYVIASFALLGAGIAALATKALYVSPPAATLGALKGVGIAVVPMVLGSESSPLSFERTRQFFRACAPTAAWVLTLSEWPLYAAVIASVVASLAMLPAAAPLAMLAAGLGVVHTAAEIIDYVGSGKMDADGPAEAAMRMQDSLFYAALIGIFAGTHPLKRLPAA